MVGERPGLRVFRLITMPQCEHITASGAHRNSFIVALRTATCHLPPAQPICPRHRHRPLPTHAACWEGHAKGTRGAFAEKCPKTKHSAQTPAIFVVKSHTAQRGGKGLRWAFAGGIRPEKGAFASKNGPSGPSRAILNIKTHTKRGLQAGELNAFKIKKGHPHLRHWALEGRSGSHTTLFLEFDHAWGGWAGGGRGRGG